jgi:pimeloyl-ACP methyl ester carboxylesterase
MESYLEFAGPSGTLRGVYHRPEPSRPGAPAVLMLHGWSGCRLGPHRMFVNTARLLAAAGIPALRFDFAGRGESDGATAAAGIETMIADARRAVGVPAAVAGHTGPVVLLGICSGCKVAVGAAVDEPAVAGLVLWSAEPMGPLRTAGTARRKTLAALRAYARKLTHPATWRKLLTGNVHTGLVRKAVAGHETPGDDERRRETAELQRFRAFAGPVLFVYGSRDPDAAAARQRYARFCREAGIEHDSHMVDGANHSFYGLEWERAVCRVTLNWLARRFPDKPGS